MIKSRLVLFFCLCMVFSLIRAQQFGGIDPSIRWLQINNDTARIIFPAGMEKQASQVASIVSTLGKMTLPTIGSQQRKIDIIFQNQTTISNGFVQLAPFRSEFELTADQNSFELGSLPWPEQLAIHEYRHVQQYNNYRVGLSKVFYYLFGQSGQELANSLAVPNWFWEGDAVYQETLVSKQGRGRLPGFFNGYRSLWAAEKKYSWMKLRNGSLRDYIPDHYPLGYMLVAYGREKYGDDFWRNVSVQAAAFKSVFYPLQKGIQRNASLDFDTFRKNAISYFEEDLKKNEGKDSASIFARNQPHFAADQEFPQFTDRVHVLYVKTTYKKVHEFYIRNVKDGSEEKVGTRSISLDNYFSYRNGKIVYASFEPDLRWGWKDFSVIRILDLLTGTEKRIYPRTKYFAPDISFNGKHIVVVQQDPDGTSHLVLLSAESGAIEKTLPNPGEFFYTYPKFSDEDHILSAIRDNKGMMALGIVDTRDGAVNWLTPLTPDLIGFPSIRNDTIYFTATHNGQDQLFSFFQGVTWRADLTAFNRTTGNYQLQAGEAGFTWTTFTAAGYKMMYAPRGDLQWTRISAEAWQEQLNTQNIHFGKNSAADLLDHVPETNYQAIHYPAFSKLINFHSWRPYVLDPDYTLSLVSDNVLGTLTSSIFATYNRNERSTAVGVDAIYAGWFPWIDGGIDYTFNRNGLYKEKKFYWNELEARAGFSIPLNFTRGKWYRQLQFGSDVVYNQTYFNGAYKSYQDSFNVRSFAYIDPFIIFSNQSQKAVQQINPPWAQSVTLRYDRAITQYQSKQFLASGYFYFPGLFQTHSLVLTAAFQQRDTINALQFSNKFPFSRGYSAENFREMYRIGVNYHIPLAYPDWGFGNIIYFLRVRANLFFDYTRAMDFYRNGDLFDQNYRSFGTEIYFDTKWWNQLPISFGIRLSHLMDVDYEGRSPNQWELILPINLLN